MPTIVLNVKENKKYFILKTLKSTLLLAFFIGTFTTSLEAAHIIGGDITYECLGSGKYRFTMKIYRDCNGGGADFDSGPNGAFTGTVTIYQGNSTNPFQNLLLDAPTITNIQPNLSNPCLIAPPNVCVEEGIYVFEVDLPVSSESYHIAYQRCCRNNTISNIIDPGGSGATYYMELTPAAQNACNNSPTFNDFPPIVICSGEDINFDHSASDPEGDDLVYTLCTPFLGGGTDQINAAAANGVAPDPDLPPPYPAVNFALPFNSNNPMGGMPPLSINGTSGLLSGVPTTLGQYVVGVCVEEYRNGVLLSRVRRDFQFNVAQCDPTVVADLMEDSLIVQQDDDIFYIKACGPLGVNFINESFQQQFINDFHWNFDLGGGTITTVDTWNAVVDFPSTGIFNGQLVLNPNTTCSDTANVLVEVFPSVEADFSFAYDTCIAGPTAFTDLSFSNAGPGTLVSWDWSFADGNSSTLQNPIHEFEIPGNLINVLTVTDINDCSASISKTLPYFPVPGIIVVAPSEFIGCQPAEILFDNLSIPVDATYDIIWDFGDGQFGSGISPTHIYTDLGVFTVSIEITSPIGCFIDTVFNDLITILPSPQADFTFEPRQPSNLVPTVEFTDQSSGAEKWKWDFNNLGASFDQNPTFTFPDTGLQAVQLIVTHVSGCQDTAVQFLDVIPEVRYFLPNAFTPNGDGYNDIFRGNGVMEGATNFSFSIWNRYGEKLFETNDPFDPWNGRKQNTGKMAPAGVYIVTVSYIEPRGQRVLLNGYATLIR